MKQAIASVLLELTSILGEFRENMVIVGGLVPYLLFSNPVDPHVGTVDIDVALNHREIRSDSYRTIKRLLLEKDYQEGSQPFIFTRTVEIQGRKITVEIDFLAGEYEGRERRRRHQHIQDLKARKARGCDLAFSDYEVLTIRGKHPGGGKDSAVVKVASIVPFIVMKANALDDRMKEKDAYDIYYSVKYYSEDINILSGKFKKYLGNRLVTEALDIIKSKFASVDGIGPVQVADFEDIVDQDDRDLLMRDVYERIQLLLELIENEDDDQQ
ncbi:MAG TPA: nucleotidyl transferase AbiEii/AbiGii toxin family protein [Acidobacteriota bacterium]|nr:nucleotidyl transferase AbiEii/AbiGii toxin family protein [Acidobacteriota bacterium]